MQKNYPNINVREINYPKFKARQVDYPHLNVREVKMDDEAAQRLLIKYHIPVLKQVVAKDLAGAIKAVKRIGYPLALKVSSPDIVHKTEVDGVSLNIRNELELRTEYKRIAESVKRKAPKARVAGFVVQRMMEGKNVRELIIGSKLDPQFGPVVMFGLGGIFVEVLEDVSFRLAPLAKEDAREMLAEIKGERLLQGFRGRKAVNTGAIISCLLSVSRLVAENPNIRELDINPLFADDRIAAAGDFRVLVD